MSAPDAFSDMTLDQAGELGLSTPAAAPPLGFFDKVKLGGQQAAAGADWGLNEMNWRNRALGEVRDALKARGIDPVDPFGPVRQNPGETPVQAVDRRWSELFDQIHRVRGIDDKFLPDYAAVLDRDGFDALIAGRRNASLAEVEHKAPGGLGAAGFIGGVLHGFKDPTSFIPVGGAAKDVALPLVQQILRTAAREAAANAGFTIASEPLVRGDAARLGQERGLGDFAFDLGASAVTGGVIGGVGGGIGGAHERFNARAYGEALTREAAANSSWDVRVARAFAEAVPPDKRTPDEQAAIHAAERDSEVKATSPFIEGPEGSDHHYQWLDTAMRALHGEAAPVTAVKPVAREALAAGTADASGTRMPGREQLKAKIHAAEGPHGGRNLLGSNALGPYQFEPRTWVSLFKRRYPGDKRSFDEIAALRENPHLNDVLINDLIAENAAALRSNGLDGEDARNLYLAHVLGSDKAVRVLRAAGEARLGELLPASYFAKNPFKPDWTANQMRAWADKRMGGAGAVEYAGQTAYAPEEAAGAEPIPTGRFDVEAMFNFGGIESDRPVLRPEQFDSAEEHAAAQVRFERERDAMEGYAPVATRDELFNPYEHFSGLRRYKGTVTADAMAEAFGISPDQLRRAVQTMQGQDRNSPFIMARERGAEAGAAPTRVMRRPPRRAKGLIEFLAAKGGIHDAGGDLRAMDVDVGRKFRKALINNETGRGLDDALQSAIDAGYFPELIHDKGTFDGKPDVQLLLDAIEGEHRGAARFTIDDQLDAAEAARRVAAGEEPPEPEPDLARLSNPTEAGLHRERLFARVGHNYETLVEAAIRTGVELPDAVLIDASDLIDAGMDPDQALNHAVLIDGYRALDQYAAETGDGTYATDPDERFADGDGFPEQFGDGGGGGETAAGGRRSARERQVAGESRARLAQLADDPERAEFGDPAGIAAEAQADSTIHDLEMAAAGGLIRSALDRQERLALRLRWLGEQEKKLGREAAMDSLQKAELADEEPWLDPAYLLETYRDDPEAGAEILDAIAEHQALAETGFRLDEEGGESDLKGILDEIDQAQKAAAEMRGCLKPNGGDE